MNRKVKYVTAKLFSNVSILACPWEEEILLQPAAFYICLGRRQVYFLTAITLNWQFENAQLKYCVMYVYLFM